MSEIEDWKRVFKHYPNDRDHQLPQARRHSRFPYHDEEPRSPTSSMQRKGYNTILH